MPRRRVGVIGATGTVGGLVARELERRGIDARLGARSPERIDAAAAGVRAAVDVSDPQSLRTFLDGVDAVVNTVGPFEQLGMPVVEAAVELGIPYVDSAAETPFIRDVIERFRRAGTPVVPACGFDYLPGDLAAAVAAEHVGGACRAVEVHYDVRRMIPTGGTARSIPSLFEDGDPGEARRVRFLDGVRWAVEVPFGEVVLVPLHVPDATVTVTAAVPRLAASLLPAAVGALPRLAPVLDRVPDAFRRRGRFTILAIATADDRQRSGVAVVGRDIYGITARLLVAASQAVTGEGAMAPAEALEPETFLDAVRGADDHGELEWAFSFPDAGVAAE